MRMPLSGFSFENRFADKLENGHGLLGPLDSILTLVREAKVLNMVLHGSFLKSVC